MRLGTIHSHTGLRGVAALVVFMAHLGSEKMINLGINPAYFQIFYWPDFAVDLFFILSGFILNWVYIGTEQKSIHWGRYLKARCARILPLYYLTLAVFVPPYLAAFKFGGLLCNHGEYFKRLLANLTLVSGFIVTPSWNWTINGPAWSISIEFFAYLTVFPMLVWFLHRFGKKSAPWMLVIAVVGLFLCYVNISHEIMGWHWRGLARGIFGFLMGFSLCMLFLNQKRHVMPIGLVNIGALCAIGLALLHLIPFLTILFALPFLVYCTAFDKGLVCMILKAKPLQWLGERSYSMYLWHTPLMYVFFIPRVAKIDGMIKFSQAWMGWVNMSLVVLSVFIISELSYRYFERPVRNLVRKTSI